MLKVGITGGIGSGKTTVCRIFEVLGIPVFYADTVAREVMYSDAVLVDAVKRTFGEAAYSEGKLNRKYLADIVFQDANELEKLNALVHPAVFRAFDHWVSAKANVPYVLKEAALLFESGSYKMCDVSILVIAPAELRIARVRSRDGVSAEAVRLRMDKQFSDEKKLAMTDLTILNDEQQLLVPQVLKLHDHLLSLAGK
ncbi:MAG TPA: dephospho-CoA kinase [Sphingobacteriaceae bacterium]